jgi:NAD(P)H-nitrite reductase large subunit
VIFGGNSGRRPSLGREIAKDLSRADALDLVHRLLEYYRNNARPKERTARFLERIGFDQLRSELLTLLPYIRLEDAW